MDIKQDCWMDDCWMERPHGMAPRHLQQHLQGRSHSLCTHTVSHSRRSKYVVGLGGQLVHARLSEQSQQRERTPAQLVGAPVQTRLFCLEGILH